MKWIPLLNEQQILDIKANSNHRPQVIFKHSTRCAVSSMAMSRLERHEPPDELDFYFLDIISNRQVSGKIAYDFKVRHESPQILLIKDGVCVYDESHSGIEMKEILEQADISS